MSIIKDNIINAYITSINTNELQTMDKKHLNKLIKENKLKHKDYKNIKIQLTKQILEKKYILKTDQSQNILNLIRNKLSLNNIECLFNDNEPTIYIHFKNNHSYLINYDVVEEKWYLSLINTDTSILIKEIFNSNYQEFYNYLSSNLTKKIIEQNNLFND